MKYTVELTPDQLQTVETLVQGLLDNITNSLANHRYYKGNKTKLEKRQAYLKRLQKALQPLEVNS